MITINDVRDGVVQTLVAAFPDIPVQEESLPPQPEERCFYVELLSTEQKRELNRRYRRTHRFKVHFFAAASQEMREMAEGLYGILRRIDVGDGTAAGSELRHEIADGILHVFVSYVFHVLDDVPAATLMQQLEQEGGLKP